MRRFSVTVDIDAPPERVWAIMSDVERWPEWTASFTKIERLDGGPLTVGSRARVRQPKLQPFVWTVTDAQPGRGFAWRTVQPGITVVGHHYIETTPRGSRVTLAVEYSGLLSPIVAFATRSINDRYLGMEASGLKRRSEGQT